ncbi:MAG: mechanosensitive ion channel [Clostridia bacterium]
MTWENFKIIALESIKSIGFKALWSFLILVAGILIISLIKKFLKRFYKKSKLDNAVGNFITQLINAILWILVVFAILSVCGVNMTSVVAILTGATVAIGLALQSSLSNLASGLIIASTKPFKAGDFVDVAGVSGSIDVIKLFTTELKTTDNQVIIIPNSTITSSSIINYNEQSERRINLQISVSYENEPSQVISVLKNIAEKNEKVLKDKDIVVKINSFADSAIIYILRCYTKNEDYWNAYWEIHQNIYDDFKKFDIEFPYKQVDVSIKNFETQIVNQPLAKGMKIKEEKPKESNKK